MRLAGWGGTTAQDCRVTRPGDEAELAARVAEGQLIARGAGRAYGDAAQSATNTVDMARFNRMLAFDPATGQLVTEAGVRLADVIRAFLPRGWFPAVTPGTKHVTIGGMVASDVHGKNHHKEGSFGAFVDWIDLMGADGTVRRLSPRDNDGMFGWTLGGMGLTGVILRVAFRLRPVESGWIRQRTLAAANLSEAIALFEAHHDTTYSVAWIDCLARGTAAGRSILMLGEHAPRATLPDTLRAAPYAIPARRRPTIPFNAPGFALNGLSVRAFNARYYAKGVAAARLAAAGVGAGETLVDWDSYFYPLDSINGWNRIYGRRGFVQFQCALPLAEAEHGLSALLAEIAAAGTGSFLAVLKRFGAQSSPISFPTEGYTLALDFPLNPRNLALLDRLDRITVGAGGRFYLAKDARMSARTLRRSDDRVAAFTEMRERYGLTEAFSSTQAERLAL